LIHTSTAKAKGATDDTNDAENNEELEGAASGQLTGIAQDQDVVVPIDDEARRTTHASATDPRAEDGDMYQQLRAGASRQLRDIVRESTERWLLATDGADEEYLREMQMLGYNNEVVEEMRQDRGKEYHGMLRLGCKRITVASPERVLGVDHLKIVSVSAGYAHCTILTQTGHLYAAGYNDRGQLGLGHRISTSQFKFVDYLTGKFVLQVSCGQQHTVCRAVDRATSLPVSVYGPPTQVPRTSNKHSPNVQLYVGSVMGADVYTWGNGMLGQLGLGRRGTSKGRLLPTLVHYLEQSKLSDWLGCCDVGAGHNFTVCVGAETGRVYSWGHAEYNQHGTGGNAAYDHVDAFFFYEPREVALPLPIEERESRVETMAGVSGKSTMSTVTASTDVSYNSSPRIIKVSCGATFTIATDNHGSLYSWGWNESGVLGHGIGHFSSAPTKIASVGVSGNNAVLSSHSQHTTAHTASIDVPISQVAAGAKHVIALSSAVDDRVANHFRELLERTPFADCIIKVSGSNDVGFVTNAGSFTYIPCHRIILACRSQYLRGYLEQLGTDTPIHESVPDGMQSTRQAMFDLSDLPCASIITVKALLEYLYLDKVNIVNHKRRQLSELASYFCLHRLVSVLGPFSEEVPPSTFGSDFRKALNSRLFADVVFTLPRGLSSPFEQDTDEIDETCTRSSCTAVSPVTAVSTSMDPRPRVLLHAHRVFLCQLEYFMSLFSCGFSEMCIDEQSSSATSSSLNVGSPTGRQVVCTVGTDGFIEEGMSVRTLLSTVLYAYTGELESIGLESVCLPGESSVDNCGNVCSDADDDDDDDDMTFTMNLLLAANRFTFPKLVSACERQLVSHLRDYFPENAVNCLSFAKSFGFTRLERKCEETLRRGIGNITELRAIIDSTSS
jgi:alpha-tubulin suppressor-like RCC1 family protein